MILRTLRRPGLAVAATAAALWTALPAHADATADIKALVKSMTDFVGAQKSISFDMETDLEIVTTQGQRLSLASSGALELSRPDKLRAERKGGFADIVAVYDGKTLSLLGKNLNLYTQVPVAGDLDHLIGELRDTYARPLPAADVLKTDAFTQITTGAKDFAYLGPGVILGQMCDHVAMRNDDVDLQIWIAQGDKPYPCRYTITSHAIPGQPQYSVEIWNWKSSPEPGNADFSFTPPAGAQAVEPAKLADTDELPAHLAPKN